MADEHTGNSFQFELRIDGSAGTLAAAGAAVRAMAMAAGLHPDRSTRFRVVIEELVREALDREWEGDVPEVAVRVHTGGGSLAVEVSDQALPLTAAESRSAPSRRLAALGFVDELHIASHGREGNVATCVVGVAAPGDNLGEVLDESAPDASDDEAEALVVRPMSIDDAAGLARCIYRCYGYTYKDPALYEPRHIAHALRRGLMRSVVAVRPDGEVVGHSALVVQRAGDPVPEAGRLVVDPRFRGHHLADRMAAVRMDAARDGTTPGIWAQAVTNHPGSQKEVAHLGGLEVGLLIGASPATVTMAALDNENVGRRTLIAMYTPIERPPRAISMPPAHAELLKTLARELELERTPLEAAAGSGTTRVRAIVVPDTGVAFVRVERIGTDAMTRIARELDGFDAFDLGAVHLDIPLIDPAAAAFATDLERLGFCFAAWLPEFAPSGDVLRVQRVGSHPVDVDHVICARSEGERIRDYVVKDWHRVRRGVSA